MKNTVTLEFTLDELRELTSICNARGCHLRMQGAKNGNAKQFEKSIKAANEYSSRFYQALIDAEYKKEKILLYDRCGNKYTFVVRQAETPMEGGNPSYYEFIKRVKRYIPKRTTPHRGGGNAPGNAAGRSQAPARKEIKK